MEHEILAAVADGVTTAIPGKPAGRGSKRRRDTLEFGVKLLFLLCGCVAVGCVLFICVYLIIAGLPAVLEIGITDFLFGTEWAGKQGQFGILPFILTSVAGTAGAVLVGVPVGILTAMFLAKVAPPKAARVIRAAVELLAGMFLNGWVDALGNLNPDASSRIIRVKNHLDEEREEAAVCYAWAAESKQQEDLVFTQTDIHEFIRTKAAAHTMVAYLIEEFGLHTDDIVHFYLAGAFGKYLDLESAITIGMYPDLPREKFVMLGNSSLDGAQKLLLDRHLVVRATELVKKITYVQFGNAGDFVEKMHAAQFLPYTDLDEYPSVKAKLARG